MWTPPTPTQWTPPKTSGQRVQQPEWNTTGYYGQKARCLPGAWCLPPPPTPLHRNIIAMQGPFSYALNCALMKQFSIRYLVTKDGGAVGGFAEKAQAAQNTGAQLIVVRRPAENGQTAAQILARCKEVLV